MNRLDLLKKLNAVSAGLSKKELLEQSNSFVFSGKQLITFNGEIMCRTKNPFNFDCVVRAEELVKILTRMNDEEIKVTLDDNEIVIKGRGKAAGLSCEAEVLLPFSNVPRPKEWFEVGKGVAKILQQAAMTCGVDESMPQTTCVHIEKNKIEACDNFRMYRCKIKTGFPVEMLIPAMSLKAVKGHKMKAVSSTKEWLHFKSGDGCIFSLRCYADKYHNQLETLLKVKGAKIQLPAELRETLERAEVMVDVGYEAEVTLQIEDNVLIINSRKDGGWYKEKKKLKYKGTPLSFKVNPAFLVEILEKTRTVIVGKGRMKIETDNVEFMVCLEV